LVGGNPRGGSDSESNVYCACLYNVILIRGSLYNEKLQVQ
jgi:hypothetical protein